MFGSFDDSDIECFDTDNYDIYNPKEKERTNRTLLDPALRPILRQVRMKKSVTGQAPLNCLDALVGCRCQFGCEYAGKSDT